MLKQILEQMILSKSVQETESNIRAKDQKSKYFQAKVTNPHLE